MDDAAGPFGEPLIQGVSLAQYAAVEAGAAAGFALDLILANEKIAADAWLDAEEGWSEQILEEDDEDEPLREAYEERLAEAQDRYGRPVRPLDDDLQAWLDFVRHWSASDDPTAMLERIGLRPADMVRLHRVWSAKIAKDPAAGEQAKDILAEPPGELPAISAETAKPRAPAEDHPWSTKVPPLAAIEQDEQDEEEDDDEDEKGDDDAPLFSPLPQWVQAGARAPRPQPAARPAPPPAPPPPAQSADDATAPPQLSPIPRPALPFQAAAAAPPAPVALPPPAPAPVAMGETPKPPAIAHPKEPLEGTVFGAVSPLAGVLPFADKKAPPPAQAAQPEAKAAIPVPAPPKTPPKISTMELHVTTAAVVISPFAKHLPFADKAAPPAAAPAAAPLAAAPPAAPKAPLGGTVAGSVVSPFATHLPFAAKGAPADPPKAPVTTAEPPKAPAGAPAGVPAAPAASPGSLTLAQYASLCAELATAPARHDDVFRRYGLGALRDRLAVDLAWQERLRRDPAEYREWQVLYEQYHRYLSGKGGGP